jgi:hypothetical protein
MAKQPVLFQKSADLTGQTTQIAMPRRAIERAGALPRRRHWFRIMFPIHVKNSIITETRASRKIPAAGG